MSVTTPTEASNNATTPAPAVRTKPVTKKPAVKSATIKTAVAAKALAKPSDKDAAPSPTKGAAQPRVQVTLDKPVKLKKPKLVRDSFTIPKAEYAVLDELKQRAAKLGNPSKKSELLRAGIKALAAMPDTALLAAVKAVPAIKTGRPAKD